MAAEYAVGSFWLERKKKKTINFRVLPTLTLFLHFLKQHKITFGLSYFQHLCGTIMDLQSCMYLIWANQWQWMAENISKVIITIEVTHIQRLPEFALFLCAPCLGGDMTHPENCLLDRVWRRSTPFLPVSRVWAFSVHISIWSQGSHFSANIQMAKR